MLKNYFCCGLFLPKNRPFVNILCKKMKPDRISDFKSLCTTRVLNFYMIFPLKSALDNSLKKKSLHKKLQILKQFNLALDIFSLKSQPAQAFCCNWTYCNYNITFAQMDSNPQVVLNSSISAILFSVVGLLLLIFIIIGVSVIFKCCIASKLEK